MIETLPTYLAVGPWLSAIRVGVARLASWPWWERPRAMGQEYIRSSAVLEYIVAVSKRDHDWDEATLFRQAIRKFERAAMDGQIEVRARLRRSPYYETIKRDYWQTAELELITHMRMGAIPRTVPKEWPTDTPVYEDLLVERAQVERVWPKQ